MEWTFWILEAKQWVSRYLMWHVLMTNNYLSFCRYNNIQLTVQNITLHCKIANMKQNKTIRDFFSNDRWAWYGRDVPTNVASNIIPGLQTDLILLTESHCGVFLLHLTVIIDPAGLLRTQTYTCDMIWSKHAQSWKSVIYPSHSGVEVTNAIVHWYASRLPSGCPW